MIILNDMINQYLYLNVNKWNFYPLCCRCLVDSKVPDSSTRFMPRKQNHVLQMQMDAFRFHEDHRNAVSPI